METYTQVKRRYALSDLVQLPMSVLDRYAEALIEEQEQRPPLDPEQYDYDISPEHGLVIASQRRAGLEYATKTELDVPQTAFSVESLLHGVNASTPLGRFINNWKIEEPEHGRILQRWLRSINSIMPKEVEPLIVPEEPVDLVNDQRRNALFTKIPFVGEAALLSYLTLGAVHESTTHAYYKTLMEFFRGIGAKSILRGVRDIATQEPLHRATYEALAVQTRKVIGLRARLLARVIVKSKFEPVGTTSDPAVLKQKFARMVAEAGLDPSSVSGSLSNQAYTILATPGLRDDNFVQKSMVECLALAG